DYAMKQSKGTRGVKPYLLFVTSAHMHVPLAPTVANSSGDGVYAASLRELDGLVGAIKAAADETDKGNTLIWFTGCPLWYIGQAGSLQTPPAQPCSGKHTFTIYFNYSKH
ncbi:hypothetical protein GOODEAATRI_022399, partial [Goodea atripinnis]